MSELDDGVDPSGAGAAAGMPPAIARLLQAADEGKADAMYQLGAAHAQGRGVGRDLIAAARWFHEAAKRGHAKAKTSMGYLYATGQGVRQDQVLAFVLMTEAAASGDVHAPDMLFKLRKVMEPMKIREAERRLRARTV